MLSYKKVVENNLKHYFLKQELCIFINQVGYYEIPHQGIM